MNKVFKALLVTGARQVGKSTMLRHLAENTGRTFVSMDDKRNRELARTDPGLFFQTFKLPILIDEVQKAPELFEHIKMLCDETSEAEDYFNEQIAYAIINHAIWPVKFLLNC